LPPVLLHVIAETERQIKTNNSFALKQLRRDDLKEFQREVRALKRFNGFNHDHMVTLLTTWKLDGKYYMLFPLAKCDLAKYWENDRCPEITSDMTRWMLKQIVGIVSALQYIHEPPSMPRASENLNVSAEEYGRHGDLKPENILLFDSPKDPRGILVVADLGLSTINSILSRTHTNSRTQVTPRYKPPECNIRGAKIRQSYDIWTLGCLLLEWICWVIEGEDAREEFMFYLFAPFPSRSQADMFFNMICMPGGMYNVVVKPQVSEASVSAIRTIRKC
jgi:serine/threonine protein kinase